jgi:hypothetical protein
MDSQAVCTCAFICLCYLGLLDCADDGTIILGNSSNYLPSNTTPHSRRLLLSRYCSLISGSSLCINGVPKLVFITAMCSISSEDCVHVLWLNSSKIFICYNDCLICSVQQDDIGAHINVGRTFNHLKMFKEAEDAYLKVKYCILKYVIRNLLLI